MPRPRASTTQHRGRARPTPARTTTATVPLERALSKLGLASRTEARRLIAEGRVVVDGLPVTRPLTPIVPERARIAIDGHTPAPSRRDVTVMLHKPRGVVTTRADPEGRPTVYDLVADLGARVVPVGRLDLATSGLLVLTSDTRLADWLTAPASGVPKVYLVTVRGRVSDEVVARLAAGLVDKGERLAPHAVVLRKASARESHLTITLTEGRNREVRRLLGAVGHEVTRLRRGQVGGLSLGTLAPGRWRVVEADELRRAFPGYPRHVGR